MRLSGRPAIRPVFGPRGCMLPPVPTCGAVGNGARRHPSGAKLCARP